MRQGNWDVFFNIHAYGNWWLLPWSWTSSPRPDDYDDMLEKARIGTDAIERVNGEKFVAGSSAGLMCKSFIPFQIILINLIANFCLKMKVLDQQRTMPKPKWELSTLTYWS